MTGTTRTTNNAVIETAGSRADLILHIIYLSNPFQLQSLKRCSVCRGLVHSTRALHVGINTPPKELFHTERGLPLMADRFPNTAEPLFRLPRPRLSEVRAFLSLVAFAIGIAIAIDDRHSSGLSYRLKSSPIPAQGRLWTIELPRSHRGHRDPQRKISVFPSVHSVPLWFWMSPRIWHLVSGIYVD